MTTAKMIVSHNAYYTPEYLRDRHLRSQDEPRIQSGHRAKSTMARSTPTKSHEFSRPNLQPQSFHHSARDQESKRLHVSPESFDNIRSNDEILQNKSRVVDYNDYYRKKSRFVDKSSSRGSKLHKNSKRSFLSTTMALSDISSQNNLFYQGEDVLLNESSISNSHPLSGFHMDQQRRYNDSQEIDRKSNSRRSLGRGVQEKKENYMSPMDVVFKDPSERELNTKQKFMRSFKKVVPKLRRNEYAQYDHTRNMKHDETEPEPEPKPKPKPKSSGVRSEQYLDEREYLPEESGYFESPSKGPPPFSTRAKASETWRHLEEIFHHDVVLEDIGISSSSKRPENIPHYQQNMTKSAPSFNTLWNYMSSWIMYSNPKGAEPELSRTGKIEELIESEGDEGQVFDDNPNTAIGRNDARKEKLFKESLHKWHNPVTRLIPNQKTKLSGGALVKRDHPQIRDNSNGEMKTSRSLLAPETGQMEAMKWNNFQVRSEPCTVIVKPDDKSPKAIISNINELIKSINIIRLLFAPIDLVAENFPKIQTFVIFIELFIIIWILYELSLLIDALCMAIKAVCGPMIAIGKFMNRIM